MMALAVPTFIVVSILFEMEPLRSDAFGAFQTKVMPWLILFCVGLGLYLSNIAIPVIVLMLSTFLAGPIVHWIASRFRQNQ